MRNLVKEKLKAGKPSVGTFVQIGHPDVSEILARTGFDWIVFDMEHGPFGPTSLQYMLQSMSYSADCEPLVRVPFIDRIWIKKSLDIGAKGILIPHIETREQAMKAVSYCKYPPEGIRSFGPKRAALPEGWKNYFDTANDAVLVVVMIESELGVKNIDEIFSVKEVDAYFIGPMDLSITMGFFGRGDPKVEDAISKVFNAANKWGIAPGIHCGDPETINRLIKQGYQFLALKDASMILTEGAQELIKKIQGWTHRYPTYYS